MACDFIRNNDGTVIAIICSSPWGIGTYTHTWDDGTVEPIYGFPPRQMNPHDFTPDPECCTPDEIAAWEDACRAFDAVAR